jgi:hypothetical protein
LYLNSGAKIKINAKEDFDKSHFRLVVYKAYICNLLKSEVYRNFLRIEN